MGNSEQKINDLYDVDMCQFFPRSQKTFPHVREFTGDIRIDQNVPGKGRGIKATKVIMRGQLIMVSRAFANIFENEEEAESLRMDKAIAEAVIKRLSTESERLSEVYALHDGTKLEHHKRTCFKQQRVLISKRGIKEMPNYVDAARIKRICDINVYGSSCSENSRGLWILPSYLNHDCIDFNCCWDTFGDIFILRATRDIKEDEELTVSYVDPTDTLEERSEYFTDLGFVCKCRLCVHQMEEVSTFKIRKAEILQNISELSNEDDGDMPKIRKSTNDLENYVNEFEQMGLASGKPEWNFTIDKLLYKLQIFYEKANNFEGQRSTVEKRYKYLNKCAQKDCKEPIRFDVQGAGEVASLYLEIGDLEGTKNWMSTAKNDLRVLYGKSDVFKLIFPNVVSKGSAC